MISQFYPPIVGGEESIVQDLSRSLADRGHDVAVATIRHGDSPAIERNGSLTVYRIRPTTARLSSLFGDDGRRHAPPMPDPEGFLALRRIIATQQPDVIHGHNWLAHSLVPLTWFDDRPFVHSLHDYSLICATKRLMHFGHNCSGPAIAKCVRCSANHYGRTQGPLVSLGRSFSTPALRRAVDLFLPVSHVVAQRSRLSAGGTPYEIVPNFLPDAWFRRGQSEMADLSGLPRGKFILFAGDLSEDKGVGTLIEAYRRSGSDLPLILVGRASGVSVPGDAGIQVLPPLARSAMPEAWRRCSIAVVPSIVEETFGLVALEAMAARCATITSSAGNLSELVRTGETGVVVPPGNAVALAEALARLSSDEGLRERLGSAAARAATAYSESAIVPRVEQIYERVRERRLGLAS